MFHRFMVTFILVSNIFEIFAANENFFCPRQCTCTEAPLRAAPFVLKWMTSWGEDDLPDLHPNDILNAVLMAKSGTARDANVNVELYGIHSTCSVHQNTELNQLLESIPDRTMALSLLQAPGCNLTIIEGSQLARFTSLRALNLQGYVPENFRNIPENKQNLNFKESSKKDNKFDFENRLDSKFIENRLDALNFALVDDALLSLLNLELLDLQYVKLIRVDEARRLRRYSKEPIMRTTLLNLPVKDFLTVAKRVDSFVLPVHLNYIYDSLKTEARNEKVPIDIMQEKSLKFTNITNRSENSEKEINQPLKDINKRLKFKVKTEDFVLPYSVYKAEGVPKLSPFRKQKNLKYLRVAYGLLENIRPEFFDGLKNLHTLTLENNNISVLPDGIFTFTPNLKHLSLAHNNIFIISVENLENLHKLETLDLNHNQISVLGPATFPPLQYLKTVSVLENPLTQVLTDTFIALNQTDTILLGSEKFPMQMDEYSLRFLSGLKTLTLKNVTSIRLEKSIFSDVQDLEKLEIHGSVTEIIYDAFSNNLNLRELNLSRCRIDFISVDAFYGLNRLKILDLSFNKLENISPGTFDPLTSLRELYLNDNRLSTLPLGIFIPIKPKLIQLQNNPWHCTCDLLQFRPAVTNKIKRQGYTTCEWIHENKNVCKKNNDRLVYDVRVAPLCTAPSEFKGQDVYHTALRHLKCTKYHWDPRLLLSKKESNGQIRKSWSYNRGEYKGKSSYSNNKLSNKIGEDIQEEPQFNWLPLTAFTPEPIGIVDLLAIAEQEGLEEALVPPPKSTEAFEEMPTVKVAQNDEPTKDKQMKSFMYKNYGNPKVTSRTEDKLYDIKYWEEKEKLKQLIKERLQKKRKEKEQFLEKRKMKKRRFLKKAL